MPYKDRRETRVRLLGSSGSEVGKEKWVQSDQNRKSPPGKIDHPERCFRSALDAMGPNRYRLAGEYSFRLLLDPKSDQE